MIGEGYIFWKIGLLRDWEFMMKCMQPTFLGTIKAGKTYFDAPKDSRIPIIWSSFFKHLFVCMMNMGHTVMHQLCIHFEVNVIFYVGKYQVIYHRVWVSLAGMTCSLQCSYIERYICSRLHYSSLLFHLWHQEGVAYSLQFNQYPDKLFIG